MNSFPMKDMHSRGSMVHPDARQDAPHAGIRKFIFGIYFVVIILFAAALIVITVLAPIEESWTTFRSSNESRQVGDTKQSNCSTTNTTKYTKSIRSNKWDS